MKKNFSILALIPILFACTCAGATAPLRQEHTADTTVKADREKEKKHELPDIFEPGYKKPADANIRLIITGSAAADRIVYYRVFIDDEDAGRSTIGEDGAPKSFQSLIEPARHTLNVEKYVLDTIKDKYIRVKNIDQPKPDSFTFELPEDRILVIHLTDNGGEMQAEYRTEFERDSILPDFSD
jgi:hypothetical protein